MHERKHGQLWFLPAGRVEPGETLAEGARREALEETGVPVVLEGVLRVEHSPSSDGEARLRVFFVARPASDAPPLSEPNEHSLEARWFTIEEIAELPLRGDEVLAVCEYVLDGGAVFPLGVLTAEGAPWLPHVSVRG